MRAARSSLSDAAENEALSRIPWFERRSQWLISHRFVMYFHCDGVRGFGGQATGVAVCAEIKVSRPLRFGAN